MTTRQSTAWSGGLFLLLILAGAGCQTLQDAGVPGMTGFLNSDARVQEEEEHRSKYQSSRNPAELRWLLRNKVHAGLSPQEVSKIIGDDGELVTDDGWIKNTGGFYQLGDEVWKWGPDRDGQSVMLIFRDGLLFNFDPHEFE